MGRNRHGPKLSWADFVMGRNDPEPPEARERAQGVLMGVSFIFLKPGAFSKNHGKSYHAGP